MRIEVAAEAAVPPRVVWSVLTDWERQADWMLDARAVEVLTAARQGVGVTLRCPTNLLGFVVEDRMRVTAWQEPHLLGVEHLGRIITGTAAFELTATASGGTTITWWEEITPPLGALGDLGARVLVAPVVRRIFRRSLANLVATAEQRSTG